MKSNLCWAAIKLADRIRPAGGLQGPAPPMRLPNRLSHHGNINLENVYEMLLTGAASCNEEQGRYYRKGADLMKRIVSGVFMVMLSAMFLIPGGATAAALMDVQELKRTNACPGCDLSWANFYGVNLSGANLEGANLQGANLYKANLAGATLDKANLQGANLGRASLQGTDLEGADLQGANLRKGNLQGATVKDAKLGGAIWITGKLCKTGSIGECK